METHRLPAQPAVLAAATLFAVLAAMLAYLYSSSSTQQPASLADTFRQRLPPRLFPHPCSFVVVPPRASPPIFVSYPPLLIRDHRPCRQLRLSAAPARAMWLSVVVGKERTKRQEGHGAHNLGKKSANRYEGNVTYYVYWWEGKTGKK